MYFSNGYVYGGEPEAPLSVTEIKVLDDMIMLITFNSGETRLFDATILKGPAFEPLKTPEVFKSAFVEYGVVCWMNGEIDCSPEYMYSNSFEYSAAS